MSRAASQECVLPSAAPLRETSAAYPLSTSESIFSSSILHTLALLLLTHPGIIVSVPSSLGMLEHQLPRGTPCSRLWALSVGG